TREIARNVQQAAQGTQDISDKIALVETAASSTGEAADEVLSASRHLFHDAESLSQEVDQFVRKVRQA
ncbi:MAG: hypothetical protein K2Y02_00310, partial [Burkholderiaceae bacterium]|nr:hypothetical protein [Burkholderiaceae bacterium]